MKINGLLIGRITTLGGGKTLSGIDKQLQFEPVKLSYNGFIGDEQADTRHHGGPEKALHHYDFAHYEFWKAQIGNLKILEQMGAFGENISTIGLDETSIAIGDIFRLGTAIIEVSQGRQPCYKLNLRFQNREMAKQVQMTGRSGWYYRVKQEGIVAPGDELVLIDRQAPTWTIARIGNILYHDRLNRQALMALSALELLSFSWRKIAIKRLETNKIENWSARLYGRR